LTARGKRDGALIRLVAQLLDREDLRQRFNSTRDELLDEFGLDKSEKAAIYTMDPVAVVKAVKKELTGFYAAIPIFGGMTDEEFPLVDENFIPEPGTSRQQYPDVEPAVIRVKPNPLHSSDIPRRNPRFELIVFGQSFPPEVLATVIRKEDQKEMDVPDAADISGTVRCSRARVVVFPRGSEGSFRPGAYSVTLTLKPGYKQKPVTTKPLTFRIR